MAKSKIKKRKNKNNEILSIIRCFFLFNCKKGKKLRGKRKISKPSVREKPTDNIKLIKHPQNPIIAPSYYSWETKATFNPAAVESNGKVHLLYRAIGDDDNSVLGYASSFDGVRISERPTYAVYKRYFNRIENGHDSPINYISGGGWSGGCEDPRLSLIDDTLYMLYTAFDGWHSVRIALTSIPFKDFKKKRWNWARPVLISEPGSMSKNWVLFPEKIKGKYAILHSISDGVLINYFDDLKELDGKKFIKSISREAREEAVRKTGRRGVGPTPIKTRDGWLVLYHISEDGKYKIKAMVLDLKDPTKILYKSKKAILEPEEDYENNGIAWGIVYSCGAVVKGGELFVYYGGADKFVCVASVALDELLDGIKQNKQIKLIKKEKMNSNK